MRKETQDGQFGHDGGSSEDWIQGIYSAAHTAARKQRIDSYFLDDAVQMTVIQLHDDVVGGKITPDEAIAYVTLRLSRRGISLYRRGLTESCRSFREPSIYAETFDGSGTLVVDTLPDSGSSSVEEKVEANLFLEGLRHEFKAMRTSVDSGPERIRVIEELAATGMNRKAIAAELGRRGILNSRGGAITADSVAQDISRNLVAKFPGIQGRWSQRD